MDALFQRVIPSPVGPLRLVANERALVGIYFKSEKHGTKAVTAKRAATHPVLDQAASEIAEYFAGTRHKFSIPLSILQGTEFQRVVWQALATIKFGQVRTYAEVARQIKRPKAVRAVGAAVGANPLSIILPCHRVIGADGSLTGFAGGLKVKKWLLEHEGRKEIKR